MDTTSVLERRLKAVANRRRLEILKLLKKNRMLTISEIAHTLHITVKATSKHLRILRDAGIVVDRKRGSFVSCRLSLDQEEVIKTLLRGL